MRKEDISEYGQISMILLLYIAIVIMLFLAGCQREYIEPDHPETNNITIYATGHSRLEYGINQLCKSVAIDSAKLVQLDANNGEILYLKAEKLQVIVRKNNEIIRQVYLNNLIQVSL